MSSQVQSDTLADKDRRHMWHQMSGYPREGAGGGPLVISEGDGAWVTDSEAIATSTA